MVFSSEEPPVSSPWFGFFSRLGLGWQPLSRDSRPGTLVETCANWEQHGDRPIVKMCRDSSGGLQGPIVARKRAQYHAKVSSAAGLFSMGFGGDVR